MDHLAILWCRQVLNAVTKSIFSTIKTNSKDGSKSIISDTKERLKVMKNTLLLSSSSSSSSSSLSSGLSAYDKNKEISYISKIILDFLELDHNINNRENLNEILNLTLLLDGLSNWILINIHILPCTCISFALFLLIQIIFQGKQP